jgi:hypothetical protein
MTQGKIKAVTKEEGGKISTENEGTVSFDRSVFGLGVMGDSTLFGVKDILQSGDKFIYSASYAKTQWEAAGQGSGAVEAGFVQSLQDAAKDAGTDQYVVAAGYTVGGVTLELNVAQEIAAGRSSPIQRVKQARLTPRPTSIWPPTTSSKWLGLFVGTRQPVAPRAPVTRPRFG